VFGGGSGSLRIELWQATVRMIAARPWVGYGPDQFLYAYLPRYVQPAAWEERFTAHAHNLVLDSWVRLGIIGGAFSLLAVAICARLAARAARAPGSGDPLAVAAAVALATIIVHGMIDNAFYAHDLAMSCWLLAWLALDSEAVRTGEGETNGAGAGNGRRGLHRITSLR
jgi:O-antigen ligase